MQQPQQHAATSATCSNLSNMQKPQQHAETSATRSNLSNMQQPQQHAATSATCSNLSNMQQDQSEADTEDRHAVPKNVDVRTSGALNDKHGGRERTEENVLTLREEFVDCVWEDFVTFFLLGSQHIQHAAIYDLTSLRPLANSEGFKVEVAELKHLLLCVKTQDLAYRSGLTIGGKHYKVRLADGRHGILARTDRDGCTVCATRSLIIIGVHDDRGTSAQCNEEVMHLGDYFRRKAL